MRFAVVVFPGTWSDHDCQHSLTAAAGQQADLVWHRETDLSGYDCVVLPGGFSYGDYLRAGAIARFSPVMEAVVRHAEAGVALPRLVSLAAERRQREGLRVAAIWHLEAGGAVEEVGRLAPVLLREPPAVTWALHIAVLDALAALALPAPDLGPLREVDNQHMQEAVARVLDL